MKLKEGDRVRLLCKNGVVNNRYIAEYYGKIEKIYKNYILLDLENYKACIGVADIIKPAQNVLQLIKNKKTIKLTKDMLSKSMVKIEHLESSRSFQRCK